jgi:hypothetical protein
VKILWLLPCLMLLVIAVGTVGAIVQRDEESAHVGLYVAAVIAMVLGAQRCFEAAA